nr:BspA family leucine-rich repeat surface protein [Elizabethkingia anophelis]HBI9694703.1 BspA family leucine-rich repeat surface protein [Elizabethkingia anophelis]HBI9698735.1 BspA family leucine-rich repeat surface protein [Elizabethkingia anophelis]
MPLADHMALRVFRTPTTDQNKYLHLNISGQGKCKAIGGKFYLNMEDTTGQEEFEWNGPTGILFKVNTGSEEAYINFPDSSASKWRIQYGSNFLPYTVDDPGVPRVDWTSNLYNLFSLSGMFRGLSIMRNSPIYGIKHVEDPGYGGGLFHFMNGCTDFNDDIEFLDTSRYTDFRAAFYDCWKFNKPVGNLNVRSAIDLSEMFGRCFDFNQPLKDWGDLSWVDSFDAMLSQCISFDQDLSFINFKTEAYINRMIMWSGLGPENYGKLLKKLDTIDFSARTSAKLLNAEGVYYDPKYKVNRDSLVAKGWTIIDAGVITYTII